MTYNLGDTRADPAAVTAAIRDANPDIIALQELSPEVAAAVDRDLADLYPYRLAYPYGIPGMGFLSRYPIRSHTLFNIYNEPNRFPLHLLVELEVNGSLLTVINAHPAPPALFLRNPSVGYYSRAADDIAALSEMASASSPTLLLGDFNASDQSADYRLLQSAGLIDSFREVGWGFGFTWPQQLRSFEGFPPMVRIDYIFHTDHFRAARAWVGSNAGSDHLPVLAELVWYNEQ